MGAPSQMSAGELALERYVQEQVTSAAALRVVVEFRRPTDRVEEATPDPAPVEDTPAGPLAVLKAVAEERCRAEARLVQVAGEVVAATGRALLAEKGFTSVEELSAAGRRKWRAEAKASAVGEIQVLLGMGITTARRLVGLACATPRTQAVVVDALARGEASLDMVLRFWSRCASLPEPEGAEVAQAMFGTDPATAATERLDTQGGLKARPWHEGEYDAALEREALAREGKDSEAVRERRRRARQDRDTSLRVGDDGMGTLTLRCPLTTGAAIYQRIERCSRALRAAGDPRTLAQLRADVGAAVLLHGVLPLPGPGVDGPVEDLVSPADGAQIARILSATPPVQLQVVIPWDVLTGRPAGAAFCPAPCCRTTTGRPANTGDPPEPAQQRGRGAAGEILGLAHAFVTPEHARVLAMGAGTTLVRLLTDPADERLIERSVASYRPDAQMRRQVRAADVMSRMPGSRRPARWCDLDHEHPFADGGATSETNLNLKDRRAHSFKTRGWWTTTMAPNRDVTWTTLLGQSETTRCHDYRQYLDQRAPLDPDQADVHPSQRTDLDERLDLACQALYAALVHRDPHAHLADPDDHHGATEHDPSLGGWIWVSHTNPDGIRRYGPPTTHPTTAEILGMPTDDAGDQDKNKDHDKDRDKDHDKDRGKDDGTTPHSPWQQRAADDDPPPF